MATIEIEIDEEKIQQLLQGKGKKDRCTMAPASLEDPLRRQLRKSKAIWEEDLEVGYGRASMPMLRCEINPSTEIAFFRRYASW